MLVLHNCLRLCVWQRQNSGACYVLIVRCQWWDWLRELFLYRALTGTGACCVLIVRCQCGSYFCTFSLIRRGIALKKIIYYFFYVMVFYHKLASNTIGNQCQRTCTDWNIKTLAISDVLDADKHHLLTETLKFVVVCLKLFLSPPKTIFILWEREGDR